MKRTRRHMRTLTVVDRNSNWHPISYRFGVIAAYCSNVGHCVFESPFAWGVETTYDVHIGLIGERIGIPISVNGTFFARCYGWGATSENTSKIAILLQRGQFDRQTDGNGETEFSSLDRVCIPYMQRGKNWSVPLTRRVALTTVLRYCADWEGRIGKGSHLFLKQYLIYLPV